MPCEVPSRPVDVGVNLIVQLDRRSELLLAPQQVMKEETDHLTVDVGIEVEDVTLDRERVVFVHCGTDADVRHALECSGKALEVGGRDVDTAARMQLVRRLDVD